MNNIHRRRTLLALVAGGCLTVVLLAGCGAETRQKVLSTFFDGVGTPPPTRRVRRDLSREIEELKRELAQAQRELAEARDAAKAGKGSAEETALPIERAKSWEEAAALLPKDSSGQVNWVQALKAGTIAPRPGIEPKATDQPILLLSVERLPAGQEAFKAVFPHEPHTTWLGCASCHPTPFQMRGGATPISMAKIYAGELCGACHGKVAFPVTACGRCHPAMGGGK